MDEDIDFTRTYIALYYFVYVWTKISIEKQNCVLFARGCYRNTPLRSRFRMRDFLKPEKHIIFSGHPPEVYWNSHTSVLQCCEVYRHNAKDRIKNDHFVLEIAYTSKILLGLRLKN